MFPRSRAAARVLLVLLGVLSCFHVAAARPAPGAAGPPDGAPWRAFEHLEDARRGSRAAGLADVKRYLARFWYMQPGPPGRERDDAFDEHMEAVVKRYQSRLSLPVTGRLDAATLARIMARLCGVPDGAGAGAGDAMAVSLTAGGRPFTFLDDEEGRVEPRWARRDPLVLTYGVSPTAAAVPYLPPEAVRAAIRSAFARWARVIPVEFVEIDYYGDSADITVGFYQRYHGDGSPSHSELELAHAANGEIHLNVAEHWSLDVGSETGNWAFDLETVAMHEIGHILGLGHSSSPEAVMYPYIDSMRKKVELSDDDIDGALMLYGANPQFRHVRVRVRERQRDPPVSPVSSASSWLASSVSLACVCLATLVTLL